MQSLISPSSSQRSMASPVTCSRTATRLSLYLTCIARRNFCLTAVDVVIVTCALAHVRFIPAHGRESSCLADPAWSLSTFQAQYRHCAGPAGGSGCSSSPCPFPLKLFALRSPGTIAPNLRREDRVQRDGSIHESSYASKILDGFLLLSHCQTCFSLRVTIVRGTWRCFSSTSTSTPDGCLSSDQTYHAARSCDV
ncbi:hypothetical protein OG21DRAFT_414989 [Imleria badia]|nr:hypothetical protein OG21DRAFT_414989 [Imleria badia]